MGIVSKCANLRSNSICVATTLVLVEMILNIAELQSLPFKPAACSKT